jgi:ubiquinol-cytochrome c reductase cytochrome b subunit
LYAWPWIEARVTRDHAEHHLLDRPRDRPVRSAIGAGVLAFYVVLLVAGAQDLVATSIPAPISTLTTVLRIALVVVPVLVALLTYKFFRDLAAGARRHAAARAREDRGSPPPPRDEHGGHGESIGERVKEAAGTALGATVLAGLAALGRRRRRA